MTKKQPQINKIGAKGDSCRFRGGGSPGLARVALGAEFKFKLFFGHSLYIFNYKLRKTQKCQLQKMTQKNNKKKFSIKLNFLSAQVSNQADKLSELKFILCFIGQLKL